jgi:hypothetical protein
METNQKTNAVLMWHLKTDYGLIELTATRGKGNDTRENARANLDATGLDIFFLWPTVNAQRTVSRRYADSTLVSQEWIHQEELTRN